MQPNPCTGAANGRRFDERGSGEFDEDRWRRHDELHRTVAAQLDHLITGIHAAAGSAAAGGATGRLSAWLRRSRAVLEHGAGLGGVLFGREAPFAAGSIGKEQWALLHEDLDGILRTLVGSLTGTDEVRFGL